MDVHDTSTTWTNNVVETSDCAMDYSRRAAAHLQQTGDLLHLRCIAAQVVGACLVVSTVASSRTGPLRTRRRRAPRDNAFPLLNYYFLVRSLVLDLVHFPRRPANDDAVDAGGLTQSKVKEAIAGRLEAAVGPNFVRLNHIAGSDLHACTETVAIGTRTDCFDGEPVSGRRCLISQKHWRAIENCEKNVQFPRVKKVCRD
jgi:hypothetical protein